MFRNKLKCRRVGKQNFAVFGSIADEKKAVVSAFHFRMIESLKE